MADTTYVIDQGAVNLYVYDTDGTTPLPYYFKSIRMTAEDTSVDTTTNKDRNADGVQFLSGFIGARRWNLAIETLRRGSKGAQKSRDAAQARLEDLLLGSGPLSNGKFALEVPDADDFFQFEAELSGSPLGGEATGAAGHSVTLKTSGVIAKVAGPVIPVAP